MASGRAQIKLEARRASALGRPSLLRAPAAVPSRRQLAAAAPDGDPAALGWDAAEPGGARGARAVSGARGVPGGKTPTAQSGPSPAAQAWGTCPGEEAGGGGLAVEEAWHRRVAGGAAELGPRGHRRRACLAPGLVCVRLNWALCFD